MSRRKITPEQLEAAVMDLLEEYKDEVVEGTKDAVESAGQLGLRIAKAHASQIGRGRYANSLTLINGEGTGRVFQLGASVTIYSKKYRIAHLLEHGHVLKVHGKIVGNTRAFPHFQPAEKQAVDALEKKIKQVIGG